MLSVEGIGRRFGALWAVRDANLTVHEGEVVGIIGPNGAGKSTLFNVIAGALKLSCGEIRFRDLPRFERSAHRFSLDVGLWLERTRCPEAAAQDRQGETAYE